jgi:hypothetical protein
MGGYVIVATFLAAIAPVFAACATDEYWNTSMADVM